MKLFKHIDRLIIDEEKDRVFLFFHKNLREVVYNDGSYATVYTVEDGYIRFAGDKLYEDDFENAYYEADETDEEERIVYLETLDDDEPQPFVKAEWNNHDHYLELESEHGINTSYYGFDYSQEVIEGTCYLADGCINQDYPRTEHQNFYKFVATDGREFYIKETHPFFIDNADYVFEIITKEEFEEYD